MHLAGTVSLGQGIRLETNGIVSNNLKISNDYKVVAIVVKDIIELGACVGVSVRRVET